MRLIRFGNKGNEKPGIIDSNEDRKDLSAFFADWNHDFFTTDGLLRLKDVLAQNPSLPDVPEEARWAAPIARPGKVVCIGLNYHDHVKEMGAAIPTEPIVFLKAANTVVGPYDPIIIPRNSTQTDWEVELAVIIGRNTRYLAGIEETEGHIAGYSIGNDVSERNFQLHRGGQWSKGKSCDNFCPLGPWLTTPDAVGDISNLDLQLRVNRHLMQMGNTRNMIFNVPHIIHYLSQFMTLEAGDLVLTGTPPGVGMGQKPPVFLKAGDVVELTITGLGSQRQVCVNAD